MSVWCRVLAGCLALLVPALDAAAEPEVGKTVAAIREAGGTPAGGTRVALRDGDAVLFREVLDTGVASALQARFLDDTILSMGASSRLTLSEFVYDPNPSKQKIAIRFVEGVFRFVSGRLDKRAYQFSTPVASGGTRGTVFTTIVEADGRTLVYVERGLVILASDVASVEIPPGFYAVVSDRTTPPTAPAPAPPAVAARAIAVSTTIAVGATPQSGLAGTFFSVGSTAPGGFAPSAPDPSAAGAVAASSAGLAAAAAAAAAGTAAAAGSGSCGGGC